ncbi:hypothetical protein NUACC26_095890 [Scytonema sp. NUACC26]
MPLDYKCGLFMRTLGEESGCHFLPFIIIIIQCLEINSLEVRYQVQPGDVTDLAE